MNVRKLTFERIILFFFGIAFFLAGLQALYSAGTLTVKYFSSTNWDPVPANISSLTLKIYHGRGDESSRSLVKATYSYYYNGKRQSFSVNFRDTADNFFGDYWKKLYKKLESDQSNGRAQAWVNPNNSDEALLDRTFRWTKVAHDLLFIVIGIFSFCFMWLSIKSTKPVNGINSQENLILWVSLLFGSGLSFITFLFVSYKGISAVIHEGEYLALLAVSLLLIATLVCGGLMWQVCKKLYRYSLIGRTLLFLDPLPGVIGGRVGGHFNVPFRSKNTSFSIRLSCKKLVRKGDDTSTEIIWQKTMVGCLDRNSKGMSIISFLFDCPNELPDSNTKYITWELSAKSTLSLKSKPIKFERSWVIPVEFKDNAATSIKIPEHFIHWKLRAKNIVSVNSESIKFKNELK